MVDWPVEVLRVEEVGWKEVVGWTRGAWGL